MLPPINFLQAFFYLVLTVDRFFYVAFCRGIKRRNIFEFLAAKYQPEFLPIC